MTAQKSQPYFLAKLVWHETEKNTVTKENMPYTADEIMPHDQQSDPQNRTLKEMSSTEYVVYNLEIIAEQSHKQNNCSLVFWKAGDTER